MRQNIFKVLDVTLEGSKLIEASAGTGKTFSIAVLALRMVLSGTPIEKILMVTFTKAATAELENRIRIFLRKGYKFLLGKEEIAEHESIIEEAIENAPGTKEEKIELLRSAVEGLDKLSVFTIHGFCQHTIDEYTFETDQAFDYEVMTDDSKLIAMVSDKYIREELNILDAEELEKILDEIKLSNFPKMLKEHLAGKIFIDGDEAASAKELDDFRKKKLEELGEAIRHNWERIQNVEISGKPAIKKARTTPEDFLPEFIKSCCKRSTQRHYFEFLYSPYGEAYMASLETGNLIYNDFLERSEKEFDRFRKRKGFITYNDQISTLYRALSSETLKENLRKKYKAVFIDEFQDTDRLQYEIFRELFKDHAAVFYIGDPKQSIYAFRGADLNTYKRAREHMGDNPLTMDKNYRSSGDMIDALDALFKAGGTNMFLDEKITYNEVNAGVTGLDSLTFENNPVKPVTVWELEKDHPGTHSKLIVQEILSLLKDDHKIGNRKITPGDIAVLVRTNDEGDEIKNALSGKNIPAVKRDNVIVFNTDEADMVKYLLKAVISPRRGAINRALNSRYFGFSSEDLLTLDDKTHIDEFTGLRKILREEGIYNMISNFLARYGVRKRNKDDVAGQRVLTNINHIAEILHKLEKQSRYTPEELLTWMERDMEYGNEEYEQRIESDEDAVQISTIHKAKGLEYKIVFAPFLSITPPGTRGRLKKNNINEFRRADEHYFTVNFGKLDEDDQNLLLAQTEQENRRLIYVALTRAVHKCYISVVPKGKKTSIEELINAYSRNAELIEHIPVNNNLLEDAPEPYKQDAGAEAFCPKGVPEITIEQSFKIHSYSELSKHSSHASITFEKKELGGPGDYEQFIFQDLPRGASVGNALHSIFERMDFNDKTSWENTIKDASKFYSRLITEERKDLFLQMSKHVMEADIKIGDQKFHLSEIKNEQKIPELEFYFSVDSVKKDVINKILGDEAELSGKADLGGLMTGSIDLLFRHNDKYYILDWKSNYLGSTVEDYNLENVKAAIKDNHYDLQYMIYTVAMKRWMESAGIDFKKQFGGVIYVFLRGVRENKTTGIYPGSPNLGIVEDLDNEL